MCKPVYCSNILLYNTIYCLTNKIFLKYDINNKKWNKLNAKNQINKSLVNLKDIYFGNQRCEAININNEIHIIGTCKNSYITKF